MAKEPRKREKDEPTLELPPLFRRRRSRAEPSGPIPEPEPAAEAHPSEPTPEPEPVTEADPSEREPEPVTEGDPSEREPEPVTEGDPSEREPAPATPDPAPAAPRRARRSGPSLPPRVAAALVGLVVGAAGTVLTWASLRGCEMLRGTDSCGGSGLLLLLAILALMVLLGALVLKALRLAENSSTSFLGVGLMSVVVLVTLMEELFSGWMFVAVPLLTAASFAVAHWVSTRFVETERDPRPPVDVR